MEINTICDNYITIDECQSTDKSFFEYWMNSITTAIVHTNWGNNLLNFSLIVNS